MTKVIEAANLSLAGEYAVASELCRMGFYAQLTLGNRKKTDILLDAGDKMLKIQVKSKQGDRWPRISGVFGDDEVLIMVDYQNKDVNERPDYYLFTSATWKRFIWAFLKDDIADGRFKIDRENVPHYMNKSGEESWTGIALYPSNIEKYKEAWRTVEVVLKRKSQLKGK